MMWVCMCVSWAVRVLKKYLWDGPAFKRCFYHNNAPNVGRAGYCSQLGPFVRADGRLLITPNWLFSFFLFLSFYFDHLGGNAETSGYLHINEKTKRLSVCESCVLFSSFHCKKIKCCLKIDAYSVSQTSCSLHTLAIQFQDSFVFAQQSQQSFEDTANNLHVWECLCAHKDCWHLQFIIKDPKGER